jgi:hypothetical protein
MHNTGRVHDNVGSVSLRKDAKAMQDCLSSRIYALISKDAVGPQRNFERSSWD